MVDHDKIRMYIVIPRETSLKNIEVKLKGNRRILNIEHRILQILNEPRRKLGKKDQKNKNYRGQIENS